MAEDSSAAYLESLKAEHRELRQRVRTVEATLTAAEEKGFTGQRATHAVEQLVGLRDFMRDHFAQEEQGGYLEEALSYAPRLGPQAAKLERQHPQLLARMDDVCDTAHKRGSEPVAWPAILDGARAAIKELMAHESGENQIIQKAFNTDLGLAD